MYLEQAFLWTKIGNSEKVVQLLIENCGEDLKQVIDFALEFNINEDVLWEKIITKS